MRFTIGVVIGILAATPDAAPDAGHAHCWHYDTFQHSVPCHGDYVCCRCGAHECRRSEYCNLGPAPGHGPYAPGTVPELAVYDGGFAITTGARINFGSSESRFDFVAREDAGR